MELTDEMEVMVSVEVSGVKSIIQLNSVEQRYTISPR